MRRSLVLSRVGFTADRMNALVYAQSLESFTQASGSLVKFTDVHNSLCSLI